MPSHAEPYQGPLPNLGAPSLLTVPAARPGAGQKEPPASLLSLLHPTLSPGGAGDVKMLEVGETEREIFTRQNRSPGPVTVAYIFIVPHLLRSLRVHTCTHTHVSPRVWCV